MSMIFFKTKGKDFCGAAVASLPLGWSATVTTALPGIVPVRHRADRGDVVPVTLPRAAPPAGKTQTNGACLSTTAAFRPDYRFQRVWTLQQHYTEPLFYSPTELACWIFMRRVPRPLVEWSLLIGYQ